MIKKFEANYIIYIMLLLSYDCIGSANIFQGGMLQLFKLNQNIR
jgi:hypothetical protein